MHVHVTSLTAFSVETLTGALAVSGAGGDFKPRRARTSLVDMPGPGQLYHVCVVYKSNSTRGIIRRPVLLRILDRKSPDQLNAS